MDKTLEVEIKGEGYNIKEKIDKVQLSRILPFIVGSEDVSELDIKPPESTTYYHYTRIPRKKSKGSSRLPGSPVTIRGEVDNLQVDPVSEDLGNYWGLKKKSERLLWILAYLQKKGIESANQKEISLIAKKLGDDIPTKGITSLLDPHKKGGRIAPSLEGTVRTLRILKPGLDYIKEASGGVA